MKNCKYLGLRILALIEFKCDFFYFHTILAGRQPFGMVGIIDKTKVTVNPLIVAGAFIYLAAKSPRPLL